MTDAYLLVKEDISKEGIVYFKKENQEKYAQ